MIFVVLGILVVMGAGGWFLRSKTGWEISTYLVVTSALTALGVVLLKFTPPSPQDYVFTLPQMIGYYALALAGGAVFFGIMEFGLLRLIGLFRLGAITRVTYYEALLQPFTLILLFVGLTAILLAGLIPYFTINEDHKMFRDTAVSLAFLFTLPVMIFSSTKVIDEEIENRTMLTLMSKPIARWQVVVGKYLGVLILCTSMLAALGLMASVCSYVRYFDDERTNFYASRGPEREMLLFMNVQALRALAPALVLQFFQLATLAAVSVAVSTRFGLAMNITAVVTIYMAANLARYAGLAELPGPLHALVMAVSGVLPGLSALDLNQRLVYGNFSYGKFTYPGLPDYWQIWRYVGLSGVYALFYVAGALSFGIALFRNRELT